MVGCGRKERKKGERETQREGGEGSEGEKEERQELFFLYLTKPLLRTSIGANQLSGRPIPMRRLCLPKIKTTGQR